MNTVTFEELESAFPGKGREIMDLIEKRTLTTAYGSVLQYISSRQVNPPPYFMCLIIAIAEVVGEVKWLTPQRVGFCHGGYLVAWDFDNKCVALI